MKHPDSNFSRLYNLRDEHAVGRTMLLLNTFFAGIANTFIAGSFYTAFLADNGIDIVNVGVITFIPYFAWVFSFFGPRLIQRFKRRRGILVFNHVFYYVCLVLATTLMPNFVKEPGQRTLWFGVLLLAANLSNALIGSGATPWHIHFIPDGKDRHYHLSICNLITNLTNTVASIGAAFLADALAGSPQQAQIIVILRLVSFVLFLIAGFCTLLVPKEYPYAVSKVSYKLKDVFLRPIQNKKFFYTILLVVFWNFICNLNANTWTYYILNTVGMKFILTYSASIVCALGAIFLLGAWRRAIDRYGWLRVLLVNVIVSALAEFTISLTTADTIWIYVVNQIFAGVNLIGAQITIGNVFYANLPKEDLDLFTTFYNFAANFAVFLGAMLGTWILALLESFCAELPVYGSQLLVLVKGVFFVGMALYIWKMLPFLKSDEDP